MVLFKWFVLSLCILFPLIGFSNSDPTNESYLKNKARYYKIARLRCKKPAVHHKKLYEDEYTWRYSFEETGKLFEKIYYSGKRLPHPVYFNEQQNSFMMLIDDNLELRVSWDFIYAVTRHIEEALQKKMADYVFLADMGHGHFYLPKNSPVFSIADHKDYQRAVFYQVLNSKKIKILYHTAEMFLFFGTRAEFAKLSPHEAYRNLTRNLIGSFEESDEMTRYAPYKFGQSVVFNIGNQYQKVAQDIDISSSFDSCFPYQNKGKLFYYDISRFSPSIYIEEKEFAIQKGKNPRTDSDFDFR